MTASSESMRGFKGEWRSKIAVSADVERSRVQNVNLDAATLRGSSRVRLDHATKLRCANDVAHSNRRCFLWRICKIRWQIIAGGVRSFFVVMATPDSADVIEMLFGDDHKFVQALELQSLDESCDMGPQIR